MSGFEHQAVLQGRRVAAAAGMFMALALSLPGCCTLKINTDTLPPAVEGVEYYHEMESECGGNLWFLSAGNLPPGIALKSDGEISGVPTVPGVYFITLGVDDLSGHTVVKGFEIIVLEEGP